MNAPTPTIQGWGGGGAPDEPEEAPDNIQSTSRIKVLEAVCEGEIYGFPDWPIERDIFLDGVPLASPDGTPNFSGISWNYVKGLQHQGAFREIEDTRSEVAVGTTVRYANPVEVAINEPGIDAVQVTLSWGRFYEQKSNGDLVGSEVKLAVYVSLNGGPYVLKVDRTQDKQFDAEGNWINKGLTAIEGKNVNGFYKAWKIALDAPTDGVHPTAIRVTRVSPDATSIKVQNEFAVSSYTKILSQRFSYPNTALVYLEMRARQFSHVPTRSYLLKLLKVKVPVNYDPETRAYAGAWDGTFKLAWTDNPAWCFYDACTVRRYGLGEYLDASMLDKWALYAIAQYCDAPVASGRFDGPYGNPGQEPRFTCNLYLQTRQEAYTVMSNLASIFRGILYWGTSLLRVGQDRPQEPAWIFTNANVVDAAFVYSGSSRRDRVTVALVAWNNPANQYRREIEAVSDDDLVARFGYRESQVVAVGCVSRGQAQRVGRWYLYSESEVTTFKAGLDSAALLPGDVVKIQDTLRATQRFGGRIAAVSQSLAQVTLDHPVTLDAGESYTLIVMQATGSLESRAVASPAGTHAVLDLALALTAAPVERAVWILESASNQAGLWRLVSITEADGITAEISAVRHDPGKYARIEDLTADDADYGLKIPQFIAPVNAASVGYRVDSVSGDLLFSAGNQAISTGGQYRWMSTWWLDVADAAYYEVRWKRGAGAWSAIQVRADPEFAIPESVVAGENYALSMVAVSLYGMRSTEVVSGDLVG